MIDPVTPFGQVDLGALAAIAQEAAQANGMLLSGGGQFVLTPWGMSLVPDAAAPVSPAPTFSSARLTLLNAPPFSVPDSEALPMLFGPPGFSVGANEWDVGGYWSAGNPTRLTVPASGYYLLGAAIDFNDLVFEGASVELGLSLVKNGTFFPPLARDVLRLTVNNDGIARAVTVTTAARLTAGDYVEAYVQQNAFPSLGFTLTDDNALWALLLFPS